MARRKQFTADDIFETAFQIVRKKGMEKLTARAVAKMLGSSTMPIYSSVNSMREVEESVVTKAWDILRQYQLVSRSGDIYTDMGLGYVLFSKEEKHLFKCIHNEKYDNINSACGEKNFQLQLKRMEDYPLAQSIQGKTPFSGISFLSWVCQPFKQQYRKSPPHAGHGKSHYRIF